MLEQTRFQKKYKEIVASKEFRKLIFVFSISLLFLTACMCFYHTLINAVDMPFDDEFDLFINPEMTSRFNLNWLLPSQGELKIVSTRLLTWVFYHINGYNGKSVIIFNFFLSCVGYYVLYKILRSSAKDFPFLPLFFIPFFSDIFWMNRLISFQSQVYFMLLFCYLSIYFGFVKNKPIISSIFVFLATISQSFVAPVAIYCSLCLREIIISKSTAVKKLIIPSVIVILGIYFGLSEISSPTDPNWHGYVYPNSLFFYREAAHLVLRGIFVERFGAVWEVYVVLASVCIITKLIIEKKLYSSKYFAPIFAILAMYCSLLVADVFARGGYGLGILPWHFDFFIYIIPTLAVLLFQLGAKKILTLYSLLLLFFHLPHFTSGYKTFENFGNENKIRALCVYDVINGSNNYVCPGVYYSQDLTQVLQVAKKLNLNFVKTAREQKR